MGPVEIIVVAAIGSIVVYGVRQLMRSHARAREVVSATRFPKGRHAFRRLPVTAPPARRGPRLVITAIEQRWAVGGGG